MAERAGLQGGSPAGVYTLMTPAMAHKVERNNHQTIDELSFERYNKYIVRTTVLLYGM